MDSYGSDEDHSDSEVFISDSLPDEADFDTDDDDETASYEDKSSYSEEDSDQDDTRIVEA
jgi:hypothetical protein